MKSALISPERVKKKQKKSMGILLTFLGLATGLLNDFAAVVTAMFVATGQMIYRTLQTTLDIMKELHIKKALDK